MKPLSALVPLVLLVFVLSTDPSAAAPTPTSPAAPLRVGIVGLAHGHVGGFLDGGALVPAGGLLHRADAELVGIVEPDQALFDTYATRMRLPAALHFRTIEEMSSQAHPAAILVFTAATEHPRIVQQCAALGIHVMMEKPLAITYKDALAIQDAAQNGKIHVLVNYETSWYRSNTAAQALLTQGALGPVVKAVFRDGHQGPKRIGVGPEFMPLLIDPKLTGGSGALADFGCYGVDLMTALMGGEAPVAVTAVTKQLQPDFYPEVDDEAEIILSYRHAVAIVEGSWNWPFGFKQMDVYGSTGYAKALDADSLEVHRKNGKAEISEGAVIPAPFDDPLHYLAAVLRGEVAEENSVSTLKTNVMVSEILDAARQSAQSGRTVALPLAK